MRAERCANSEALAKYEREIDEAEKINEAFNEEIHELYENTRHEFASIADKYDIKLSLKEWVDENV